MSEVSNKLFVHYDGTKQDFIDSGYPDKYHKSIVFINGDGDESNSMIYTHGEYYGQGVIVEGDASNSAVLKNGNNQTISKNSIALGESNVSGLMGWYYKAIEFVNDEGVIYLYLTHQQQIPKVITNISETDPEKDIQFPDKVTFKSNLFSIINGTQYDDMFELFGVEVTSHGRIALKPVSGIVPFNEIAIDNNFINNIFDPDDYSVYCLSMPETGIFDMGQCSFSAGYMNKATNGKSIAFGYNNHAYGKFSFVEGRDNKASYSSHAEGKGTHAKGLLSHSEGSETIAEGNGSHAEGCATISTGDYSHAEGESTHSIGKDSHAEGWKTISEGAQSHSEGAHSKAKGQYTHAEGYNTIAEGISSHAEGYETHAKAGYSHAEGWKCIASGGYSHAEGYATKSKGKYTHAEGYYTIANNNYEHASGTYNISNSDTLYSVGIGTSENDRKNAFEIKQNGEVYINIDSDLCTIGIIPISFLDLLFTEIDDPETDDSL